MVNITIYSKKNCSLCEKAKEKLLEIRKECPFSLTEIDIENDTEVFERYKYLIPVIEVDGKEVFNYEIDETRLKIILDVRSQLQ